jgi:hypothetical protein
MSSRKRAQTCRRVRTQWGVRDVGCGPVGDNGTAGTDGKDGRARTPMAQTGMWARMAVAGTGMWVRTLLRVYSCGRGRDCREDCELEVRF